MLPPHALWKIVFVRSPETHVIAKMNSYPSTTNASPAKAHLAIHPRIVVLRTQNVFR